MLDAKGLLGGCEFEGGDVWLGLYGVEQWCRTVVQGDGTCRIGGAVV